MKKLGLTAVTAVQNLLKSINDNLKERKTGVDVDVGFLDQIKGLLHIGTDRGLRMSSEDRIKLAELYVNLQKYNLDTITEDGRLGYNSLLNDINQKRYDNG